MGVKIQIRRGNQADLPTLDTGEFGFTTDTERLYIGNPSGSGNTLINFGGAGFDMGNGADGYVTFYTGPNAIGGDNDFFWDRENNRLGIHTTTPTHELTIDGYITPATDNVHQLGTPTQRWEALWLGPGSLHIHSNPSETFTSFDWRIGIDQTTGNEGKLIFSQGDQTYFAVDPVTGNVSFDAGDELRVSGSLVLPELLSAPLSEVGYGKVYVDSDDKALHFLDSVGEDFNLLITGGTGTGTGNVDSSEGADGYVTFFIAPGVIAGDNDFFFNRVSHNLTLMSNGKIGVGITSPTSPFHAQLESAGTFYQAWTAGSAQFDLATVSSPSNMAVLQSWNGLHILLKPQSGFVGINSSAATPANALDVSGAVSIGSGFYGTTAPTSGLRVEGLVALGTTSSPGTTALLIDQDADDTNTIEGRSGGSITFGITPRSTPSRVDFSTSNLRTLILSPAGNGVGISTGTTNVANKLDVAGSVSVGTGYAGVFAGTNNLIVQGNVGIGTVSPYEALTVNGIIALQEQDSTPDNVVDGYGRIYVKSDNKLYFQDGLGVETDITTGGGTLTATEGADGYLAFFTGATTLAGDNDLFYDRVNSRLGVGTTTPTTSLHVLQDLDGTTAIRSENNTVSSTAKAGFFAKSDQALVELSAESSAVTATFDGVSRAGTALLRTATSAPPHAFFIGTGTPIPLHFIIGDLIKATFGTNGNLGLGTTSPFEALTVNGIIALQEQDSTPDNVIDGYGRVYVKSDNKLYFQDGLGVETDLVSSGGITATQGSDGYVAFFTGANTIAGDNDLFFDRVNNRLGVGTSSTASHKLHVTGTDTNVALFQGLGAGGGTSKLSVIATDSSGNYTATIDVGSTATVFGHNTSGRDLILQTNNTDRFTITGSAGLVGIGATPGTYRLTTHSTDANIAVFQANNGAGTPRLVVTGSDTSGNYSATIDVGALRVSFGHNVSSRDLVFQTNSTDAIYILGSNQNVGLGTSTPANKLDVEGAAVIGATYSGTNTAPTGGLLVEGTVGIGTVSPHEKLTLNGILSLQEQDAFDRTHDGYGSLWAKSDGSIHFTNDAGTDYNLTAAAGLSATQGADGYIAFFTSGNTLAGDNDFFWERTGNRLQVGGNPAVLRKLSVLLDTETGDGIGITNTSTSAGGFAQLFLQSDAGFLLFDQFSGGYTGTITGPGGTISQSNMGFIGTSSTSSGLIIHSSTAQNMHLGAGNTVFMHLTPEKNVGIGTVSPIEPLTVNGPIALQELTADAATQDGYGKLYVRDDNKLYYKDGLGAEFDLTAASGVSASQGADGYLAFFTGANTIAGDNDLFYDRVNSRLGIGTSTPTFNLQVQGGDHTSINVNAPLAFQSALTFSDTTNGQDWSFYRVQGTTDLALHSSAIPGNLIYYTSVAGDGYVLPGADITHHLGNPTTRWESLYLGPASLHFRTTAAETVETLDWTMGVGTNENKGDLLFYQSGHKNVRFKDEGGIIVTATKQYHGLSINNGTNLAAQLIGFTANNDGGGLDLLTGAVTRVRLNADAAVPNYINHQGALGIGTNNPTTTSRLHIVVASGGGDVIRMSRDVSFDWDIGIDSGSDLFIETGAAQRSVHIDATTGNVGLRQVTIGDSFITTTTGQTDGLLVEGKMAVGGPTSISGTTAAIFRSSGSGHIVQLDRGGGYSYYLDIDGSGDFDLMDNDGTTSRIHVDTTTGYVGIGTTTPIDKLHVSGGPLIADALYGYAIVSPDEGTVTARYVLKYGSAGVIGDTSLAMLTNRAAGGAVAIATNNGTAGAAGEIERIRISGGTETRVGIGTRFPIEALTVIGSIAVNEDVQPATQDGYGKIWVDSNGELNFVDDNGSNVQITSGGAVNAAGAGVQKTAGFTGADGYVTFWTGTNEIAGDNDFFFNRENNRLTLGGGGTYAGSNGTSANPTYATGSGNTGIFEDDNGNLAFSIAGTQYFQMTAAGFITTTAGGLISVAQGNTVNTAYSSNAGANTGIFFPSGPQVAIAIAGTEVMRATTNRRIAIGTTTADAMLHVAGDGYFDGYLMPYTDNMWGLGTPDKRWRDLYLGPESLHIVSKFTDGGRPNKDFRWTVDEGGILTLSEDSTPVATFSSAGVSFPAGGGAASAPQYTISSSQTTGFSASFDTVYRCDPSSGGFTVTLPTSSGGTGKTIIVKNTTASTNTIVIQGTGGELIDGSSTAEIEMGYTALTFVSYGTGWGRI